MIPAGYSHSKKHYPVMLPEVLGALKPVNDEIYVDGTFGAGGYTRGLLMSCACRVYAIDRDLSAKAACDALSEEFKGRVVFLHGCFGSVESLLSAQGISGVNGFVLDLGVSSMQIDTPERGFSFRLDRPLDMRMDAQGGTQTAADIVNQYEEEPLADLIYLYGEERHSRRVARAIVNRRNEKPFERTSDLADVVRSVVPRKSNDKIDSATRTFQALRIAVNDELGEIERALDASLRILKPGGRLVVVTFHSLEDTLVKRFMQEKSQAQAKGSRHRPDLSGAMSAPLLSLSVRKAIKPSSKEESENPRSRSAKLRVAVRTDAPFEVEAA